MSSEKRGLETCLVVHRLQLQIKLAYRFILYLVPCDIISTFVFFFRFVADVLHQETPPFSLLVTSRPLFRPRMLSPKHTDKTQRTINQLNLPMFFLYRVDIQ